MACLTLLFIVILATVSKVTSLYCSDQQLPASGDVDLQQVTTIQYCLVDDCTIMKIDTGEKLDIVYTTDSLIVTTPTDGHTSKVTARLENELHCALLNAMLELQYTLLMVMVVYNHWTGLVDSVFFCLFFILAHIWATGRSYCYIECKICR